MEIFKADRPWSVFFLISAGLLVFSLVPESRKTGKRIVSDVSAVLCLYHVQHQPGDEFYARAVYELRSQPAYVFVFKKPTFVLKLFQIRLREIIKVNLLPAFVIGAGLDILFFASGGTDHPLNYAVIFVSVLCMSVFFSVHYLTIYYLLQPYNAGTEVKSGTYAIVLSATYFVLLLYDERADAYFGLWIYDDCLLYFVLCDRLYFGVQIFLKDLPSQGVRRCAGGAAFSRQS